MLVAATVLVLAAIVGTVLWWSRVRGPSAVRTAQRVGLVVLCQVTAVVLVAGLVNRAEGFASTWSDLGAVLADALGGPSGDDEPAPDASAAPPSTDAAFARRGGLWTAHVTGAESGVVGDVLVWTPPGYDPHRSGGYRVLLALGGYPSQAVDPINGLHLETAVPAQTATPALDPTIVVAATTYVDGHNQDCADLTDGPQVATWLTDDVPALVAARFDTGPHRWSVAGLSTGAYCAVRLAATDPDQFGAAMSLAGQNVPDAVELARHRDSRTANDLRTLVHDGSDPPVALFLAASRTDGTTVSDAQALAAAVGSGITADLALRDSGAHTWSVWADMAAQGLGWLGNHQPS